jgi:hypothetical protein
VIAPNRTGSRPPYPSVDDGGRDTIRLHVHSVRPGSPGDVTVGGADPVHPSSSRARSRQGTPPAGPLAAYDWPRERGERERERERKRERERCHTHVCIYSARRMPMTSHVPNGGKIFHTLGWQSRLGGPLGLHRRPESAYLVDGLVRVGLGLRDHMLRRTSWAYRDTREALLYCDVDSDGPRCGWAASGPALRSTRLCRAGPWAVKTEQTRTL